MRRFVTRSLLVAVAAIAGVRADVPLADCLFLRADGVAIHYSVERAVTPAAREQGLMGRTSLPERQGMWFDFETTTAVVMWMKNTLLALDLAFVDAEGRVVYVHERATPLSLSHIVAPTPVRYVLEANGGELATYGIGTGARVVLPVD